MAPNRIRVLRRLKNMTQEDLAQVLDVQRAAVSKYENGILPLSNEMLEVLADYFDTTIDYILGRTDDPENSDWLDNTLYSDYIFAVQQDASTKRGSLLGLAVMLSKIKDSLEEQERILKNIDYLKQRNAAEIKEMFDYEDNTDTINYEMVRLFLQDKYTPDTSANNESNTEPI